MADKPRLLQNSRDLALTIIPLLVLALIVLFASGNFQFGFGANPKDSKLPAVDAQGTLTAVAHTTPFPVRAPAGPGVTKAVPDGWKANSTSQAQLGSGQNVVNVGYLPTDQTFLQLSQSDGPADSFVRYLLGATTKQAGTIPVGDRTWQVYGPGGDGRNAWLLPLDGVTLALSGSATVPSFEQLATAVQDQAPLAR
ncbi:DUF4245 domain-containing protein [Tsukamurella sp. 8F]|uniref:DUF4245 domain-containing protein n=1 Tax=unclassified Tsukamurella TaxID=2633480 RepID=UPI0023B98C6D|nr:MULTISPECIES: DUF4245 domain-containing protein [unclassified Tsukamurella]MDF0530141.1 DUF4245 domain-containing protein [Tsukamurella sp. 8J]MDF0586459.1 DUF4245 domain-containing protein [Tsukamurella sp. 8F]